MIKRNTHKHVDRDRKQDAIDIVSQAVTDGYSTRHVTRQRADGEGVVRHHTRRRMKMMKALIE